MIKLRVGISQVNTVPIKHNTYFCKRCGNVVSHTCEIGFYECNNCNSLTNNVRETVTKYKFGDIQP